MRLTVCCFLCPAPPSKPLEGRNDGLFISCLLGLFIVQDWYLVNVSWMNEWMNKRYFQRKCEGWEEPHGRKSNSQYLLQPRGPSWETFCTRLCWLSGKWAGRWDWRSASVSSWAGARVRHFHEHCWRWETSACLARADSQTGSTIDSLLE